jgi:N-acetylglucosaminyldiphosphoundecaprenol N-acetyl-beta-D-mannosaminyltransferase
MRSSVVRRKIKNNPEAGVLPEIQVGSLPVHRITFDESATWVINYLKTRHLRSPGLIVTPNAQHVTLAEKDTVFREACRAASLSVPDGASIVLASRILGTPIQERVAGCDLMERLCGECAEHDHSVFFLGGLPGAAEKTAKRLLQRYPLLKVAGTYCPPRGFETNLDECAYIRERITHAAPDLLLIAFGAPKQEIWAWQNCLDLPVGLAMSVGSSFDTHSGMRSRAPLWMQQSGVEWLFRLASEPRRLWKRYLLGNLAFLYIVLRQRFSFGRASE